jgi:hypothetical protein
VQWVLLSSVVVGLCLLEFRILRDRARLAPVREAVKKEAVVSRTPISAQWGRGWWGRGNAKGMHLVVREHSLELSYPFPGGRFLSEEWFCLAREARMTMGEGRFLPPQIKRECIVLSIPSIDNADERQVILLSSLPPRRYLRAAWDSLAACGVQASGDPPQDR